MQFGATGIRDLLQLQSSSAHSADTLPETVEALKRPANTPEACSPCIVEMKAHTFMGSFMRVSPGQAWLPGCSVEVLSSVTRRRGAEKQARFPSLPGLSLVRGNTSNFQMGFCFIVNACSELPRPPLQPPSWGDS